MVDTGDPAAKDHHAVSRLVFVFIGFIIVGIPLVGYLWDVLTDILAGDVRVLRIIAGIATLLLLFGMLTALARTIRRVDQ
jgi:hypothetical protein